MALVLFAAPLLAGLSLGSSLRTIFGEGRLLDLLGGLVGLALIGASLWAAPLVPWIGSWDLVAAAVLLGLGFSWGARIRKPKRPPLLFRLALLAVSLGLVELAARQLPTPTFPAPSEARLTFEPEEREAGCAAMYPALYPRDFDWRTRNAANARSRVLHLGDSMVAGNGVAEREAFPAILEELQPGVAHINAGIPATGTDCHLVMLRAWLDRQPAELVVLHVFTANDLADLDRPYACCENGPVLSYESSDAVARCPSPRWAFPLRALLARSPPPYWLRVATSFSAFARHASAGWSRLTALAGEGTGTVDGAAASAKAWEHFSAALRAMRDELARRKIPLVVTVLPYRRALENGEPAAREIGEKVVKLAREIGVPALDAWGLFEGVVQRDGADPWFADAVPWDVHFSAAGHRRLAQWLAESLPPPAR